jgi:hypothetical protein
MVVRITELVAWLALQGAKGATSASMLDRGIVGAMSAKTLYNMVSADRAALGTDVNGASLLIADRSTGVYRLSDEVTVDALRFVRMTERGIDGEDPHVAAELCGAALNLIDDMPVGNGSGRHGWWSSIWEARIGRLTTKAAGRLAELARHGIIDVEVARTGIDRARLTAEGEGELHRVAMVLEAWAGNDERVECEWMVACAQAQKLEADLHPARRPRVSSWPYAGAGWTRSWGGEVTKRRADGDGAGTVRRLPVSFSLRSWPHVPWIVGEGDRDLGLCTLRPPLGTL